MAIPQTVQGPVQGPIGKEPAGTIGSMISGVLIGLFGVLKVVGVDFADDLPMALNVFIAALLAIPAISGWVTRFFVYSPVTVEKMRRKRPRPAPADGDEPPGDADTYNPMDPDTWDGTPIGASEYAGR